MKSLPTFSPDFGSIGPQILAIQQTCLEKSLTRAVRQLAAVRTQPSTNLTSLPTELIDQILSYLTASSAIAFKLTCRVTYATDPSLSDELISPCFNRREAFLAKCYLESLSDPSELRTMLCSGCVQKHPVQHFSIRQRKVPAQERKCYGTSGFTFLGKPISTPAPARGPKTPARAPRIFNIVTPTSPVPVDGFPAKRRFVLQGRKRLSTPGPQFDLQLRGGSEVEARPEAVVGPEQAFRELSQRVKLFGKRRRSRSTKRVKATEIETLGGW